VVERQVMPEDLAEMPPGPKLGALLAGIDRARLNGHDAVVLMQARARQIAHEQAQLLADMVEVAHCPPGDRDAPVARMPSIQEFADDEIRMALQLTRRAADTMLALAVDLLERLPRVHAALLDGEIDLPRARVFSQETQCVPDRVARQVVDEIIDVAPILTTGQLAARLRRLVISSDPDAVRRRQEESVTQRRVVTELDPAGTASLAGWQLPAARAASATARINALAHAAKRLGDARTLDQLRADTFLDLLEGIEPGLASASTEGTPNTSTATSGGSGGDGGGSTRAARGGVELRVPMTTLMRLSDEPGELAGWGPVIAEVARDVAERQVRSPWRVSVYDSTGQLVHHGRVRRRPTAGDAAFVRARDGTCRAPGCRAPASRTDIDHTRPYAKGGDSTPRNLGLLCRHDHRLKHEGGWRVRQIADGVFVWRSRLDHAYVVAPDPPPST
jgi:hypothetical protein